MKRSNEPTEYRDKLDQHNVLSRIAGVFVVIVFVCTYYVGLYTETEVSDYFVIYSTLAIIVVFGGAQIVGNNIGKILDIVKRR